MIGYITIGALDHDKSVAFYDAVLGAVGYARGFNEGGWAGYGPEGSGKQDVMIVSATADGKPAKAGNGIMIAFKAKARGEVDAAHMAALKAGGSDEGKPGPRPADSKDFYGAYMRDPTGNKICVFAKGA